MSASRRILKRRIYEHREGILQGFSKRHGCKTLVWYEMHDEMEYAIAREKQIKGGSWQKKLALIEAMNPQWQDLYEELN